MITSSYAFLSYKGGAGRTVTTANVAAVYAAIGFNVVCIDCDWDAPGMHNVFLASAGQPAISTQYVDATTRLGVELGIQDVLVGRDSHGRQVRAADYVADSLYDFTPSVIEPAAMLWREARGLTNLKRRVGTLRFLPGTTRVRGALALAPPAAIQNRLNKVMSEVGKLSNPGVDYVFVDSLSGLNANSEIICAACKQIVLCFRLGVQHREGAVIAREFFRESRSLKSKPVRAVPSSVFRDGDIEGMGARNRDCVEKAQASSMLMIKAAFGTPDDGEIQSIGYYPDLSVSERVVSLDPHRRNDFERLAARMIGAVDSTTFSVLGPLLASAESGGA